MGKVKNEFWGRNSGTTGRNTVLTFSQKLFHVSKRKIILTQEEILQLMNKSVSVLTDCLDANYAADKTYELCKLERKSITDERNDGKNL
ncbi:hypothetical protein TNCV_4195491 [Trichonephila clavipes]|nr:hypothetical protein TNCV_4195491 [Trichonephila clavipes]